MAFCGVIATAQVKYIFYQKKYAFVTKEQNIHSMINRQIYVATFENKLSSWVETKNVIHRSCKKSPNCDF